MINAASPVNLRSSSLYTDRVATSTDSDFFVYFVRASQPRLSEQSVQISRAIVLCRPVREAKTLFIIVPFRVQSTTAVQQMLIARSPLNSFIAKQVCACRAAQATHVAADRIDFLLLYFQYTQMLDIATCFRCTLQNALREVIQPVLPSPSAKRKDLQRTASN